MRRADAPSMNPDDGIEGTMLVPVCQQHEEESAACPWCEVARVRKQYQAHVRALVKQAGDLRHEVERWRNDDIELVDVMRTAYALLHRTRPEAMNAASIIGDALRRRTEAMLPHKEDELRNRITVAERYLTDETRDRGERIRLALLALEEDECMECGLVGGDADCPSCG